MRTTTWVRRAESKPKPKTVVEVAEQIGKSLAIVSAATLTISVFYDFAFLHALGLSFNFVPTSLSDHIRSAIVYMPQLALLVFALCLVVVTLRTTEREQEIVSKITKVPVQWITFILSVAFMIAGTKMDGASSFVYYAGATSWFTIVTTVANLPRFELSKQTSFLIVLIPMCVMTVGGLGCASAELFLRVNAAEWILKTKQESSIIEIPIAGARRFSDVVVVVDMDRVVSVLPSSAVVSLVRTHSIGFEETNMCRLSVAFCKPKKALAPAAPASAASVPSLSASAAASAASKP